jgi:drug/metabolite transporter (DMT)-like permease
VFSIFFGVLIFNEVLTTRVMVGGSIIILAAALPHLADIVYSQRPLEGKNI